MRKVPVKTIGIAGLVVSLSLGAGLGVLKAQREYKVASADYDKSVAAGAAGSITKPSGPSYLGGMGQGAFCLGIFGGLLSFGLASMLDEVQRCREELKGHLSRQDDGIKTMEVGD